MGSRLPKPGRSLADLNPEIAAQADGWDPTTVSLASDQVRAWRCNQGHTWETKISNRSKSPGCPFCVGKRVLAGFNDIATTHPELTAQADGWDPTTVSSGSDKVFAWKCTQGHIWETAVKNRTKGNGCPFCSGNRVVSGVTDLSTVHPEIASQADGWDPTTVAPKSNKTFDWRCEKGHAYRAVVASRTKGDGCPICSGRQVLVGFNDLATMNPELAAQADGWDPTTLSEFSNKRAAWKCNLGHKWMSAVNNRSGGNGCPFCSGKRILPGYNDLATLYPEIAMQAVGWDPTQVSAGSHEKALWQCAVGHTWSTMIKHRTATGLNCPYCSGKALLKGFNDLATTHPQLSAQAVDWDPSAFQAGSNKKVKWKCDVGHEWSAWISNRSQGIGCPSCAKYGYDPNKPGWLYFLENDDLDMFQIGISNFPDYRLNQHSKGGWQVIKLRGPMDGHLTQKLETAMLHALERRGAILGHKAGIMKFDGYSEAWTKESLWVSSLQELLDFVYEDEEIQF